MATKRAATKKRTGKKSASKKGAGKRGASKKGAGPQFPINFKCIEACFVRYRTCLMKGVNPDICMKRLIKNLNNCKLGIFPTAEE